MTVLAFAISLTLNCVRVAVLWRRVQTAQASQRQTAFQVEQRLDESRPQCPPETGRTASCTILPDIALIQ